MATTYGGFKVIASSAADVYVSITNTATGAVPTVYSDLAGSVSLTIPVLVPQGTSQTVYFGASGGYTLSVQFGGAGGPQIADPRQGATIGVDIQTGEFGVYDYSTYGGQNPPIAVGAAAQFGLLGQSYPILASSGTAVNTTQVLTLAKVYAEGSGSVANIEYNTAVVGATLTGAQQFVGLYSAPGVQGGAAGVITLIGTCPAQDTNFTVLGPHKAAVTVVAGKSLACALNQQFYVGVLSNGTTPVSLMKGAQLATAANYNTSLAAGNARFLTSGSGLTALPATVTISGGTLSAAVWAGIS